CDRGLAAEVNVKILQLGRPIAREHPFGAGARRPADLGRADACGVLSEETSITIEKLGVCRGVNMAIGQAARAIEQQVGRDGDAEAAPHRTEPRKPCLRRKERSGIRKTSKLAEWYRTN